MKNLLIEVLDNRSYKSFLIPLLILVSIYMIHYLYFVPFWPFTPDTLIKLDFIKENLDLDINNQHHLRWGSYFIYKLASYFIDQNFITLTTTSFIIFLLSALLFTYNVHINLGLAYSCLFVLFWITNKSKNLEIFSFSNVNQTLLVLSILFLYLQRSTTLSLNFFNAFFISLILFWLYGIKETNIFFFPLLFFFKIFRENLTLILNIVFFCILFYLLETIFLNLLSDQNFIFGRISELFSDTAIHKNDMLAFNYEGIDSTFKKFFLIFYRWYSARDWDTTIFYLSFFFSIFFLFNIDHKDIVRTSFSDLNSLLILSFFLFNTFFIISLSPPTMGQPLNTRVLTILLPFSFISIIIFTKIIISRSSNKIISSLLIIIVLFTFFLDRFTHYLQLMKTGAIYHF